MIEMEKKENENPPEEQPVPDVEAQTEAEAKVQAAPARVEKPQMSRLRRFWRASLAWLAVVAIAFTAGVLSFYFMRYQPQGKELSQAYQNTSELQNQVNSLTGQLKTATDRLAVLEDAQTHVELLQILSDVNNARLALINKDVSAAKADLGQTSRRLEDLAPKISAADASLTASLPQRLALILSGLDSDVDTAKVDLELLAGSLLEIESSLFGK